MVAVLVKVVVVVVARAAPLRGKVWNPDQLDLAVDRRVAIVGASGREVASGVHIACNSGSRCLVE